MLSHQKSQNIAKEWIDAWNSHDLEAIISHYTDNVEFTSPFVVKLIGDKSGTIRGKSKLREYFSKGLEAYPDLKFELINVLLGVESLTLYYKSVNSLDAAEVLFVDSQYKISKVIAHYTQS